MSNRKVSYEEYCKLIQSGKFVSNDVGFANGNYTVKVNNSSELKDIIDICKENEVSLNGEEIKKMIEENQFNYVLVHVNKNTLINGIKEYTEIINFESLYDSSMINGGKNNEL